MRFAPHTALPRVKGMHQPRDSAVFFSKQTATAKAGGQRASVEQVGTGGEGRRRGGGSNSFCPPPSLPACATPLAGDPPRSTTPPPPPRTPRQARGGEEGGWGGRGVANYSSLSNHAVLSVSARPLLGSGYTALGSSHWLSRMWCASRSICSRWRAGSSSPPVLFRELAVDEASERPACVAPCHSDFPRLRLRVGVYRRLASGACPQSRVSGRQGGGGSVVTARR